MNPLAEELKRRTFRFALTIVRFCRVLRTSWEGQELSDQRFRSGTRAGANYRAACRARSHDDFVSKIGIVVEEADETVYWLELIAHAGLVPTGTVDPLLDEASQLSQIFNQSQLTVKDNPAWRHRRSKRLQGEPAK